MLGSRMGLGVLGASFSTASIYNIEYILIQRFRLCVFTFHVLIPKSLLFSISVCCPGFPRPPFSTRYSMILFPGKKDTIYQKCCWSEDSFYSLASHNSHPFRGRKLQTANINVCDCPWPLMRLWCATHLSAVVVPALQAARALLVPVTVALARLAGLGLGAAPALVNLPPRAAQCWPIINIWLLLKY